MGSVVGLITQSQQRVQFIQAATGSILTLDASLSETHSRESPPTEFEVEDGGTVSDNILVKPFGLKIQGIISDTPLSAITSALSTVASVALPPVGLVAAGLGVALSKALSSSKSPSVAAYVQLLGLQSNKQTFDVLTTLNRYTNMFIKGISVPRDSGTGKALIFDVDLVELLLVKPQTVNIQIYKDADLSAAEANVGKQEVENPVLQRFKQGQATFNKLAGT